MKKVVTILFLLLFFACKNNPVKKPANLLSEDKMEEVLYDYYVMQSAVINAPVEMQEMELTTMKFILRKHKIDSVTFVQNHKYYAGNINDYKHLNKRILARLEKIK
jgi:H2-forming N5,N10-methylenetetrahydromethanopterin dehydrogenase-like enzyme